MRIPRAPAVTTDRDGSLAAIHAAAVEMAARCREQDVEVMLPDVVSDHQGFCDWIAEKVG